VLVDCWQPQAHTVYCNITKDSNLE
jgi:hypothetical protein